MHMTLRIEQAAPTILWSSFPFLSDVHLETVYFTGHVQGVGFRYTALQVAKEFEVTGRVENLADGRVLLEAEGNQRDVTAFVAAVEERMHGHIRRVERSSTQGSARYPDFCIQ